MTAYVHLHVTGELVNQHVLVDTSTLSVLEEYQQRYPNGEVVICSVLREPRAITRMVELLSPDYRSPPTIDLLTRIYECLLAEEAILDDTGPDSPI